MMSDDVPNAKWQARRYFRKIHRRWCRQWREPGSRKVYEQSESRWVWERDHGPIPKGYEIHHRDGDGMNNEPTNLQLVTASWHNNYHQRLREDHQIIEGVEHRWCPRCKEYKPFSQFYRRKTGRRAGNFTAYCKGCSRQYLRKWQSENREHVNTYAREYRRNRIESKIQG